MKKTYISPELIAFRLNTTKALLTLSQGDKENDGVAETKKFWGGALWEEEEEETDDTPF